MVRRCSQVASRSRDLRRGKCDRGVALEPVLPVGHDAFTPGKTGGDDRQVVVALSGLDRARLGDVLAADGPDEETIGSALDRGRGNDDGVAASFEQHPRVDELAGPQLVVIVGKHRLEPDGRGGLVDGVVDQQQRAGGERVPVVLIEGDNLHRTARHGGANVVERARGQGEQHRGRSREDQRRDRALVVGMHDVSGIDEAYAHASIVRRGDAGVVEVGLRRLEHRLVGIDHGAELIDLALLLVDDLLRVMFDLTSVLERSRSLLAEVNCAMSCAFLALAWSSAAWNRRGSILASTSPFLTCWPSVNSTSCSLPSTWEWIPTVNDACTVPSPVR